MYLFEDERSEWLLRLISLANLTRDTSFKTSYSHRTFHYFNTRLHVTSFDVAEMLFPLPQISIENLVWVINQLKNEK